MRLISNEESLVVAGGLYVPIWEAEEIEQMQGALDSFGFDEVSFFADKKGTAKKSLPEAKDMAEAESVLKSTVSALKSAIPDIDINGSLEMAGKTANGTTWKLVIEIKGTTK